MLIKVVIISIGPLQYVTDRRASTQLKQFIEVTTISNDKFIQSIWLFIDKLGSNVIPRFVIVTGLSRIELKRKGHGIKPCETSEVARC